MSRNVLLEMRGGGQTTKSTYAKGGVRIKRTCAYKGEGGSNISHFGAYVLIEWPQATKRSFKLNIFYVFMHLLKTLQF